MPWTFLHEKIDAALDTIEKFKDGVCKMFGRDKALKQKTGRSKAFNCPHCKVKSSTVGDLRMHMKASHSVVTKRSKSRDCILDEDLSLLEEDKDAKMVTLEEEPVDITKTQPIICDWLPCDYKSTDRGVLIKHIGDKHGIGNKNVVTGSQKVEIDEQNVEIDEKNVKIDEQNVKKNEINDDYQEIKDKVRIDTPKDGQIMPEMEDIFACNLREYDSEMRPELEKAHADNSWSKPAIT